MLYTIGLILIAAWLLGIIGVYTVGTFVHLLLLAGLVLFAVGMVRGRHSWA